MAAHMRAQRIGTGMRLTFANAVGPLTRVPLLSAPDVLVVDVLHQPIHVTQIANCAAIPEADGDLVTGVAAVIVILVVSQQAG